VASFACSPLVAVLDKGITMQAAGTAPSLLSSVKTQTSELLKDPVSFLRSPTFLLLFMVYVVTYMSANSATTLCDFYHTNPAIPVLVASTFFNTVSCIYKDTQFAKMFGATVDPKVPPLALLLWLARDLTLFLFVFVLPPLVIQSAPALPELAVRFSTPILAEAFTTHLHLLGLGLIYTPDKTAMQQVYKANELFADALVAKTCRIIPALSIGASLNHYLDTTSFIS